MAEFAQYRNINNKLRKRFNLLRKPNLKEASESYRKLSLQLSTSSSFPQYGGYCMYNAAKCEHQIVGSLKEQLLNQTNQNQTSGSNNAQQTSTGTSSTNQSSSSNRATQALENLVHEAIWTEFQTWLDTARIFREIDPTENDINGAISAYAHAIQTCPSSTMLPLILGELGSLYVKHHRFYEAAEVYMEAGFYRDAIDHLLRGHYYQDAYHCYQEMFRKQPNYENYTNLTDSNYYSMAYGSKSKSKQNKQQTESNSNPGLGKSSILSLFKKKQQQQIEDSKPEFVIGNSPGMRDDEDCFNDGKTKQLPPLKSNGNTPFDFNEQQLTIDDYINFFLLRLYLYDPVKYEYPSPIIPIPPVGIEMDQKTESEESENPDNIGVGGDGDSSGYGGYGKGFVSGNDDKINKNESYKKSLKATELSLPYFDMINSASHMDRSIKDIIKLNHLLETLYLSYRNELRPSLDNEYSDFDIIPLTQQEIDQQKQQVVDGDGNESSEETEFADENSFSSSGRMTHSTRDYDSKDDSDSGDDEQHQQQLPVLGTSTTSGPKSPVLKLFETGELDDISARLERLAKKLSSNDIDNNPTEYSIIEIPKEELQSSEMMKQRCQKRLEQLELEWRKDREQEPESLMEDPSFGGSLMVSSSDDQLRQHLAQQLYPLLNGNQIQLLYDILEDKD